MKPVKRRTFLGSIAAATAVGACATPAGLTAQDLQGEHFGGCRIERAQAHLGAVAVLARDSAGTRFQIDVLRRSEEGPAGIAHTEHLALFLANRGDGQVATNETHGLFLMELGRRLEQEPPASGSLMTWSERQAAHPSGAFLLPA